MSAKSGILFYMSTNLCAEETAIKSETLSYLEQDRTEQKHTVFQIQSLMQAV